MIAEILAFGFVTALASAWHGGDHSSKGYIIATHGFVAALIAPVTIIAVALFWGLFRRGRQAIAELDYLSFEDDVTHEKELEAIKGVYPKPIGFIVAKVMRWLWKHELPVFETLPPRRKQELLGGFVLGVITSAPLVAVMWLLGGGNG